MLNLKQAAVRSAGVATLVATAMVSNAQASDSPPSAVNAGVGAATNGTGLTSSSDLKGTLGNVTNILLYFVGAISIIMLVIGGLQYVLSTGDAKRIESAKQTILYALIGLVVASLAYAIVNFVFVHIL